MLLRDLICNKPKAGRKDKSQGQGAEEKREISGVISWLCLFSTRPLKASQFSFKCLLCLCESFFSISDLDREIAWGSGCLSQEFLSP